MAEKIISPGVFTNEVDQSYLPAGVMAIGAAVVGPTVKGPAGIPTIVSSYSEYTQIFGDKFESGSGAVLDTYKYLTSYSAQEYLKYADTLTVVRVADGASTATSIVSSSTTVGVNTATASFNITSGSIMNDLQEFQIDVGGTEYRFITSGEATVPTDASPIFFFSTGSTMDAGIANLVTEINAASIGITATVQGTSVVAGDTISLSGSSAGTTYNGVTLQTGSGATISTTTATLGGGTDSTTSANCLTFTTLTEGALQNNAGTWGTNGLLANGDKDNVKWDVSSINTSKGTFTLTIRRGNDTNNRKAILESYNNLNLDPNSPNYIAKRIGDENKSLMGTGESEPFLYTTGDFANRSKYVRVTVHKKTLNYLDENGTIRDNSLSGSLPSAGSGSFAGGSDGNVNHPQQMWENIAAANSQGISMSLASSQTAYEDAINLLKNQDQYDINLLTIPGIIDNLGGAHSAIITSAINAVEARGDCFLVLDALEFSAGSTSGITDVAAKVATRDTNYAAAYWPWVKIPDADLGQNVWVPASTMIPSVYAFNDRVAAPWFAPAGLNRGGIDMAIRAERKLTQTNRDTLYDSNVNPIATFPNTGVTVYGQKTMQKKASALDRVNVRRLLIAAKKFIASTSKFLVFENNTAATRNKFLSIVNPYFESVQQRQGLYAFKVVMDTTNNTPDVIDRNQMVGQIFLQPAKTAEFILIDFNIMPTGAAFPE